MHQFYYKENKYTNKTPVYEPEEDLCFRKTTWDVSKYMQSNEKLDDMVEKLKDSLKFTGMDITSYSTPHSLGYNYFLKTIRGKFELYVPTSAQANFIQQANYKFPTIKAVGEYKDNSFVQIDVNSLYHTVMREKTFPYDVPIWCDDALECFKLREKINKSSVNNTYHIIECDVEVNPECRLHLLPNEKGRWNYTGNISKGVYTSMDLHLAKKYGGYKIKKVYRFLKFLKSGKVFKKSMDELRLAKIYIDKTHGKPYSGIVKKLYNGIYGKTLQVRKTKSKRAKDTKDANDFYEKHDKVTLSATTISAVTKCVAPTYLGVFVQAFARQYMFKFYDALDVFKKAPTRCFYSKVDSLLITKEDFNAMFKHRIKSEFGYFKIEADNIKHFVIIGENNYMMELEDGSLITKGRMKTTDQFLEALREIKKA